MNTQINKEMSEEIKNKRSEDATCEIVKTIQVDLNEDIPDFSAKSRKIRLILNKVTEDNFEKLVIDLVTSFEYNIKLLKELIRLIFERATKGNFSDLYSRLCSYFTIRLKLHSHTTYKAFKTCLHEKCDLILSLSDEKLVPYAKFLALLFKEKLIKSPIIYQFLDLAVIESSLETQLEAACNIIQLLSPYLAYESYSKIENTFRNLSSLNIQNRSKKIQFLTMNILETKEILLTPVRKSRTYSGIIDKDSKNNGKGVRFANSSDFQPVQCRQTKRILKHGISEEVKSALWEAVSDYMGGKTSMDKCKEIFQYSKNKERQLVNQIFKYSLTQYNHEQEFIKICKMIICISEEIAKKEVIETGLIYTVEAINDIKLDSPMATKNLTFIINHLHETGIIENFSYLLNHFNS